ncbi:1-alkyl-2-acetylglycerophosphocholine esterase [Chlorella sorokiniana]|uniref:1-alkyl-2-acetylglycerophosphocholine esterase n=1 Tax=Chlorella sorokiniana TaxID=3076 RepID=A0A2P6TZ31_CHLSO|nr:1-alkyl-2-acetylglycerophosphocholine esterase [Chlorella sorokiniana]|eukprot:PRW59318.1 1-alkyl-2-acetylglycerophosphocholine esterase [Chlorella sorokiniana]
MPRARSIGVRLLLCTLLAAAHRSSRAARAVPGGFQAAAVQPAALPAMPQWAQELDKPGESRRESLAWNKKTVADANDEGRQLDFVLWGDSLTAALQFKYPETWNEWFGEYDAAPLGVSASTVEELAWRIMGGRERLNVGPKVIAILIGTNNEMDSQPAAKLGVLLTWLERAYPASKLLVIPPPPSWQRRYIPLRDAYGAMLRSHPRVFFSLCGAGLDPASFDDMKDGVHPVPGGYDIMLRCLKSQVAARLSGRV